MHFYTYKMRTRRHKILNPKTGRWVARNGELGRTLVFDETCRPALDAMPDRLCQAWWLLFDYVSRTTPGLEGYRFAATVAYTCRGMRAMTKDTLHALCPAAKGTTTLAQLAKESKPCARTDFVTRAKEALENGGDPLVPAQVPWGRDGKAGTLLHLVAIGAKKDGDFQVLESMARRCRDVDTVLNETDTFTPLHFAIMHRNPKAAKILLAAGADPTRRTGPVRFYLTHIERSLLNLDALMIAIVQQEVEIIHALLDAGVVPDGRHLFEALYDNDDPVVQTLRWAGAIPRHTLVGWAILEKRVDMLQRLHVLGQAFDPHDRLLAGPWDDVANALARHALESRLIAGHTLDRYSMLPYFMVDIDAQEEEEEEPFDAIWLAIATTSSDTVRCVLSHIHRSRIPPGHIMKYIKVAILSGPDVLEAVIDKFSLSDLSNFDVELCFRSVLFPLRVPLLEVFVRAGATISTEYAARIMHVYGTKCPPETIRAVLGAVSNAPASFTSETFHFLGSLNMLSYAVTNELYVWESALREAGCTTCFIPDIDLGEMHVELATDYQPTLDEIWNSYCM